MALNDMQTRLKAVLEEVESLLSKPTQSDDEMARVESLIAEGNSLKVNIERAGKASDLANWARQSGGMLALVAPGNPQGAATAVGMRASGATELEKRADSVLVNSDGEGILDDRTMRLVRDPNYGKAFRAYLRKGLNGMGESDGLRTLQEGLDPSGGFTVPEDILNRIIAKEPAPTRVAGRVQTFNTSRDTVVVPKINYTTDDIYTTGMRVTWAGEVPASATAHRVTDPVFGQLRVPIFTATMSLPLTNDLVEDSAFDLVAWCSEKFSETALLLKENMALNGTGVGQPYGILANPNATDNPATVASTVADALAWDGLQNLAWALPEQYDDAAAWVFNKTSTGLAIAKLLDGNGRPLWTNGTQDSGMVGSPKQRQLLGYDVLYSAFAPDVAASAYPIVFGDLRGYTLVNRVGFSIQVLRELYAETNQILLLGRIRFGGAVAEPWRLKVQVVSA